MLRAVVCVPTYNERNNLESMVRALGHVLDVANDRVLVIDDDSPDGTGDVANGLARELPWLVVLHRPRKDGLGSAYVAGFRAALDLGARLVVTMDCDFSHDPRDVPHLLAAAADADVVLGSRYVPGGRNETARLTRRVLSRAGSVYARVVLGVDVRDLTGGFKCFQRTALESIDLDRLRIRGYAANIELTYFAIRAGLRVREVPIRFAERRADTSKMTASIAAEAAWRVPALRARALRDLAGWRSGRRTPSHPQPSRSGSRVATSDRRSE